MQNLKVCNWDNSSCSYLFCKDVPACLCSHCASEHPGTGVVAQNIRYVRSSQVCTSIVHAQTT